VLKDQVRQQFRMNMHEEDPEKVGPRRRRGRPRRPGARWRGCKPGAASRARSLQHADERRAAPAAPAAPQIQQHKEA
jgi:hypothetical protein